MNDLAQSLAELDVASRARLLLWLARNEPGAVRRGLARPGAPGQQDAAIWEETPRPAALEG